MKYVNKATKTLTKQRFIPGGFPMCSLFYFFHVFTLVRHIIQIGAPLSSWPGRGRVRVLLSHSNDTGDIPHCGHGSYFSFTKLSDSRKHISRGGGEETKHPGQTSRGRWNSKTHPLMAAPWVGSGGDLAPWRRIHSWSVLPVLVEWSLSQVDFTIPVFRNGRGTPFLISALQTAPGLRYAQAQGLKVVDVSWFSRPPKNERVNFTESYSNTGL